MPGISPSRAPSPPRPAAATSPAPARAAVAGGRRATSTVTGITHASQRGPARRPVRGAARRPAGTAPSSPPAAAAAGAVAVLTDPAGAAAAAEAGLPVLVVDDPRAVLGAWPRRVYGDPTARLTVIGITGTAGKTSTAYLIESGLRAAGHVTGLIGTVETRLGDLVVDSVRTTPEATDLHALFAAARRARRRPRW